MADRTRKLDLLLINPSWQFADEAYNRFILDADNKLVGVSHIQDASHWTLWKPNANYVVGDVIRYTNLKSSQYAYCTIAGQTDTTEPSNNVTGSVVTSGTAKFQVLDIVTGMSQEGVISIWLSGSYYKRGDVVYYGSALYRCTRAHDATTFEDDKNNWQEVFASVRLWSKQTFYNVGDTILNDGVAYQCKTAHTSENTFKEEKWERLFEIGIEFSPLKQYYRGDIIKYAGNLYKAIRNVKGNFQLADWEKLTDVIRFWDNAKSEPYVDGDTAVVHNTLVTIENITSTDLNSNTRPINASIAEYDINALKYPVGTVVHKDLTLYVKIKNDKEHDYTFFEDAVKAGSWKKISNNQITKYEVKQYKEGEIVYHEGSIYVAKVDNNGEPVTDTSKWEALGGSGDSRVNEWQSNTTYKENQLVTYQGVLLKAKSHTSTTDIDFSNFDVVYAGVKTHVKNREYGKDTIVKSGSNLYLAITNVPKSKDITDRGFWQKVTTQTNISDWESDKQYLVGDIVTRNKDIYRATHDSKSAVFDIGYWEKLVNNDFGEWQQNTDYTNGQLITVNSLLVKSNVNHNSGTSIPMANYKVMYASIPQWNSSNYYPVNTVVIGADGGFYCCINSVKDKDITPSYWKKLGVLQDWTSGKQYFTSEVVYYKNDLYRALENSKDTNFDVNKWKKITQNGTIKIGTYTAGKNYEVGEVIKLASADTFYYVKNNFTATLEADDIGVAPNLTPIVTILDFDGRAYGNKDIVRYEGKLYRAKNIVAAKSEFNKDEWDILNYSQAIRAWDKKSIYEKDSIITIYDVSYKVEQDFKTQDEFNHEFDYVNPQYSNISEWKEGAHYKEGVTVISEGRLYKCLQTHKSVHGGAGYTDTTDKWFVTNFPGGMGLSTGGGGGGSGRNNIVPEFDIPINGRLVYELVIKHVHWGNAGFGSFKILRVNTDNTQELLYEDEFPPEKSLKIYDKIKAIKIIINGAHMGSGFSGDTGTAWISDIIPSFKNENWKLIGDLTKIQDWQKYKKYEKEDIVYHNSGLYRCKKEHEDVSDFRGENWEQLILNSRTIIEDWKPTFNYSKGDIVFYKNILYRAPLNITGSTTFQQDDWEYVNGNTFAEDWEANKSYFKNEIVIYGNSLYRARLALNKFTFESDDWERLSSEVIIQEWNPNTLYNKDNLVIYNNGIWRAGSTHTSAPTFEIDKWENLSGGGGGGTIAGWKQITKLNTPSGTKVTIKFPETLTFCFPPIDVLWLQAGAENVIMNSYTFDASDSNRFIYNENKIIYDGIVHCNTYSQVPMSDPTTLGSGFISVSDEINFNEYNYVDGIGV
jgi:hypothetical protein|nr:MAG TPA: Chitin oligosaccharide deacetylase [Caudoviricetes sp.]